MTACAQALSYSVLQDFSRLLARVYLSKGFKDDANSTLSAKKGWTVRLSQPSLVKLTRHCVLLQQYLQIQALGKSRHLPCRMTVLAALVMGLSLLQYDTTVRGKALLDTNQGRPYLHTVIAVMPQWTLGSLVADINKAMEVEGGAGEVWSSMHSVLEMWTSPNTSGDRTWETRVKSRLSGVTNATVDKILTKAVDDLFPDGARELVPDLPLEVAKGMLEATENLEAGACVPTVTAFISFHICSTSDDFVNLRALINFLHNI